MSWNGRESPIAYGPPLHPSHPMTDRRQRQKEQRAAKLEEERKAASRRELRRRVTIALGIGAGMAGLLAIINLRGSDEGQVGPSAQYLAYRNQETACGATPPQEETLTTYAEPVDQELSAEALTATISTSCGQIVIELDPEYPETVNSFVFLARQGFYDGTVFHRIIPGFVIQGGDPNADGTGGPGYVVPNEFPADDFLYEEGVVAMANSGGASTGSQFFVVVGEDARFLNNTFSVLGRVITGKDTLEAIEAIPTTNTPGTNERSRPTQTVYIEGIEIEP